MKRKVINYFAASFIFLGVAQAQTTTGPGITDDPPTAVLERQNEVTKPGTSLSKAPTVQSLPRKEFDPQERSKMTAPRGKEAQEAVKSDELDLTKKEIKRKQEGN